MANALAEVKKTFSVALTDKLVSIENALPNDFNKARFVQNALAVINDNPALQKVPQTSLLAGLVKGSILGLDFAMKECYLIPYGNQVNFQTDYKGKKKLIMKYSIDPVIDVASEVIREGDTFELSNDNGVIKFNYKPLPFNTKKVVGAFAYVLYKDGHTKLEMMSVDEMENVRKHSKASNSMAWKDFTTEMYRKTVINRLAKNISLEFENPQQKDIFNSDTEIETDIAATVEAEIKAEANTEDFVVDEHPEKTIDQIIEELPPEELPPFMKD